MTIEDVTEQYYNKIFMIARHRLKNVELAKECTNDVFLVMIMKWDKINKEHILPWLMKTLQNKIKEYQRKQKRNNRTTCLYDNMQYETAYTEMCDMIYSDEDIEAMKQAILNELSPKDRELYEDYFVKKMSYSELSEKLKIQKSAVSARVVKLKKLLKKKIMKSFGILGATAVTEMLIRILQER